jgi:pyrimidine operon attenuation protein/uracil phosphoribosyltransferase
MEPTMLQLDAEALYAELRDGVRGLLRDGSVLVGIWSGGAWLAERLQRDLGLPGSHGVISSALHRDDFAQRGLAGGGDATQLPFAIDGRHIVLVDDVLYTGRTIRAALDALIDFGRPRVIQLIALVDRGHRELPIKADYVGKNLPTSLKQSVQVRLQEIDGTDEIVIEGEP